MSYIMKKIRTIRWYYDYEMYKLDCTFVLEDDVIV